MKKSCMLRIGLIFVFSLFLSNLIIGSPASAKTFKWTIESAYSLSTALGKQYAKWGEDVTAMTGGRIQAVNVEPGAVVPVQEIFQAVSQGVIQGTGIYPAYYSGAMPEADIQVGMPFAWESIYEIHDAYFKRGMFEELRKIYDEHNIYLVAPIYFDSIYGYLLAKPVRKPSDFKGLKLRDIGGGADFVAHYGASPTVIPGPDLYMALKLGTIDGAHYGPVAFEGLKLGEVTKYFLYKPHTGCIAGAMLLNKDAWNELPQDLKDMINRFSFGFTVSAMYTEKLLWLEAKKKYNIEGIEWSDEDTAAARAWAINELWEKIAQKSPRCRKLVDIVRQQTIDLGRGPK